MTRFFLIAGLGLCLVIGIAKAEEDAASQLLASLANMQQLQGDFNQRQMGEGDQVLAASSGHFRLLRPGYFAWDIQAPDSQLIIADPEHLWHYDRDLETVTRRPIAGREEMSPLQVLGGDEAVLRERFQVSTQGEGVFLLTPAQGDPGFKELTLYLDQRRLQGMRILDSLGQRVQIEFSNVDSDSELNPADFEFTPPEGVDLFYHEQ